MATGPLQVDPLLSYARRLDEDIRIVLQVHPSDDLSANQAFLRLLGPDEARRVRATVTPLSKRVLIEALVPADQLTPGTWRLKLRLGDSTLRNLRSRLILSPGQPVALLCGRPPQTLLPEPEPRVQPVSS